MLTNTVIKLTSGDLRAQQICAITFRCDVLISQRVRLSLIVYSSTSQKKCLQIPCIILSLKGNIIWTCSVGPAMSLSVAFISFVKKVAIDFCHFFFFFWGYCSHWIYKIKSGGHRARLREKGSIYLAIELSLRKIFYVCTHTRSSAPANDAKIVHNRNAQCKTKEAP